jgi:peptidoglycan hydrolase-like protein with peptidoglycan-binding domain
MASTGRTRIFHSLLAALAGALLGAGCLDAGDVPGGEPTPTAPSATTPSPLRPLQLDDRGPEVHEVYDYLRRYGYFPNPALAEFAGWRPVIDHELADPERFDADLEQAVFLYQVAQGLPADGTLNAETAAMMARPRCSFPDYYGTRQAAAAGGASFVASGLRWQKNNLTYSFNNFTPDLSNDAVRADVRNALGRWAGVTTLSFTEVGSGSGDMRIGFYYGDHGDGYPFDAQYGVLAHAFYPSDGRAHFDESESWSDNGSGIDYASVAIHEFGHSIGLDHSPDQNAVMYAAYSKPRRDLTEDDVRGGKSIYGDKPIAWSSSGPIGGRFCTQITEGADPDTWNDNWLCSTVDYGFRWSSAGAIGGMRCTQITEGSEPPEHTWNDNFLCVPTNSPLNLAWSSAGPIAGRTCTMWHEAADPHTWMDNFLCY